MENPDEKNLFHGHVAKPNLTKFEVDKMVAQNSRLVSEIRAGQLEKDAKKYWDLFYKRNDTRFFKDRHWTTREFVELLNCGNTENGSIFEVGCGVGNLIYPLIEDGLKFKRIFACDLSPRAVDFVKVLINKLEIEEINHIHKISEFHLNKLTQKFFLKKKIKIQTNFN